MQMKNEFTAITGVKPWQGTQKARPAAVYAVFYRGEACIGRGSPAI